MNDVHNRPAEGVAHVAPTPTRRQCTTDQEARENAALAAGVVVIEAGRRSGTLDTARWAHRLTRPVFATPGSIYSAASDGVHDLLRQHKATAVTHPDHVIDAITRPEPTDHH